MKGDIEVKETTRSVFFRDGGKATFNNVTFFNPTGTFLRIGADEGYAIINTQNVNYMLVPNEARVA